MGRALKHDIPGTDWRLTPEALAERGLEAAFQEAPGQETKLARPLELEVDLGFGRGEFVTELAMRAPERAFLAVEYSPKRVLKMARRLARTEIANVRLVHARAEQVVEECLPDASVTRFWINFPDPWPKKRHHRRRMIQPAFVRLLVRRLVPGGQLEVATDHPGYAEHVDEVLSAEPGLVNLNAPERHLEAVEGRPVTGYEAEWRALGRSFHFFSYRKPPLARSG